MDARAQSFAEPLFLSEESPARPRRRRQVFTPPPLDAGPWDPGRGVYLVEDFRAEVIAEDLAASAAIAASPDSEDGGDGGGGRDAWALALGVACLWIGVALAIAGFVLWGPR